MPRIVHPGAALLAALALSGCYTGTREYVRPHAVIRRDSSRLMAAVRRTVTEQGLRVVQERPEAGLVVAVTAPSGAGDFVVREHWRIVVRANEVTVEMLPETKVEEGGRVFWSRNTEVCDCYHYARERELLHAIRAHAASAT